MSFQKRIHSDNQFINKDEPQILSKMKGKIDERLTKIDKMISWKLINLFIQK